MNINDINQLISHKNKKRKKCLEKLKNDLCNTKICYKLLKPIKIDKLIYKILNTDYSLFPEENFKCYKQQLFNISINLSRKINSQICRYRSAKGRVLVEYIAKICIDKLLTQGNINISKFINAKIKVNDLYKKELNILPALILIELYNRLRLLCNYMKRIQKDISYGAITTCVSSTTYSNAFYYGLIKYNKNLVKIGNISNINYRKCVFYFIEELNDIDKKIKIVVANILYIYNNFKI